MAKLKEAGKSKSKMATVKYPGTLGQPYKHYKRLAAALENNHDWLDNHELEHIEKLLNFYKIAKDDPKKWLALSFALARDHVPAFKESFTGRRGRPKDIEKLIEKRSQDLTNPKSPPGRPKKFTDKYYRDYIELIDLICTENGLVDRGRIKRAIEIQVTSFAQKNGLSVIKALKRLVPYWQKIYSEAKKIIPENRK